jgi:hypothetical protein
MVQHQIGPRRITTTVGLGASLGLPVPAAVRDGRAIHLRVPVAERPGDLGWYRCQGRACVACCINLLNLWSLWNLWNHTWVSITEHDDAVVRVVSPIAGTPHLCDKSINTASVWGSWEGSS